MELPCIYLAGHESIPSLHFTSNPGISGCRDGGGICLLTYSFILKRDMDWVGLIV